MGPEAIFGPVHICEQMIGLHGSDDAQLFEAWNIGGVDNLRVLDAIARGARDAGLVESIEGHRRRLVADGVEANLKAGVRPFKRHGVELLLCVLRKARIVGVI